MTEIQLVLQGEIVDEGWYEESISAYVQADDKVTEGKWERARVAYGLVGKALQTGERGLVSKFAGDVRRSASHLYHEAFAFHLKVQLQELGQPNPSTLTPTFYIEATKALGTRRAIEAGDKEATLDTGAVLERAEDEHWTVATLGSEVRRKKIEQQKEDQDVEEKDPNAIKRIVRAGAMEYVVEFNDGNRHTIIRSVLMEQGFKKCSCCEGFGVVERHHKQSQED